MQKNVARTGYLAFKQGLLFGLSLGIFFIICDVILSFAKSGTLLAGGIYLYTPTSTGNVALFGIGGPLVPILVYLLAGLRVEVRACPITYVKILRAPRIDSPIVKPSQRMLYYD